MFSVDHQVFHSFMDREMAAIDVVFDTPSKTTSMVVDDKEGAFHSKSSIIKVSSHVYKSLKHTHTRN